MYELSTFRQRFRVSLESFNVIATELRQYPELNSATKGGRPPIPVNKALAVLLWTRATNENMDIIAERFDMSRSTVHYYVHKLIDIINVYLLPKFIKWPAIEERPLIAQSLAEKRGFPGILGAIDGCHIPIICPAEYPETYVNRKGFHSILLQAVCDNNMNFIDCVVGWPGSVHDARVYRNSLFNTGGHKCAPDFHLLGDSAYPLASFLMTAFKDNGNLNADKIRYNYLHSSTRMVIERAFGLLKGRFPILKYVRWSNIENICKLILAACVLSNICLLHEEDVQDFLQDEPEVNCFDNVLPNNTQGLRKREHIVEYLRTI